MPAVRRLRGDRRGEVVYLESDAAQALIASGHVELAEPEKPETPEATTRRRAPKRETR